MPVRAPTPSVRRPAPAAVQRCCVCQQAGRCGASVCGAVSPSPATLLSNDSPLPRCRFADTIAAQFFSHTHLDEYQVVLDGAGNAISTVYIAPSVSPWVNLNPGYKLYHIDPYHWVITHGQHLKLF